MDQDFTGQRTSHEQEDGVPARAAETQPAPDATPQQVEPGMEDLLRENDYAFRSLRRGETVEGTVVRVDQDEVLIDVGLKSEGVIQARELYTEGEDAPVLEIGDRALVYVMHPEGPEGHAILSLRRARMERSWREIEEQFTRGEIIEAPVIDFNKGGLIVDVTGIRGFVPVSQVLDLRSVSRQEGENEEVQHTLQAMKGRRLPLKIIEINRSRNRLILSERAAVQERRTQLKDELMDQLQPGQIRRGVVSNLTSFGAFVDLGGADGLVHVSELSYNRVNHPNEVLQVGQDVDVFVLSVDRDTKKIALSLKKALPDPWTTVDQQYHVGQVVPAVITKLAKFGAFAKVEEGLEGLIHLSELTDLPVQDALQVVREGQNVDVKIIHINSQRRRLGLSVRQAVEPQSAYESFGDDAPNTPFAGQDFGPYADEEIDTEPVIADAFIPDETESDETDSDDIENPPDETASDDESSRETVFVAEAETSPDIAPTTSEQEIPAAQYEPEPEIESTNGTTAGATAEATGASTEAEMPIPEEDTAEVAHATSQGSASE